jgi:CelD/BcsL family acetyltransferase involved in cellulose biosynthesis
MMAHAELTVELLCEPHQLAGLAAAWPTERALAGRAGATFRSHEWLLTWWRHFGGAASGRSPFVIAARGGSGRLVGLLPLYLERAPARALVRARLMGDGPVGSDYLGVICDTDHDEPVARTVWAFLRGQLARAAIDLVELDAVDPDGALAREIAAAPPAHLFVRTHRGRPCPLVRVPGDFATYLAARPAGVGAQLKRRRRWLAAQPGFALECLTRATEVRAAFPEFLALHRERWAAEGGGDGIATAALEAFHREAVGLLAERDAVELHFLRVGGQRRAALYGLVEPQRFFFYQSGHQRAWRPRSVGTVLLGAVLERCAARGLEFDFGHGDERYKLGWANAARQVVSLRATRPVGLGRLFDGLTQGRSLAGRLWRRTRSFARGRAEGAA